MSGFKLSGIFGSHIVSKELNDRFATIYGKNTILDGFILSVAGSPSSISVTQGIAIIDGVLVSPGEGLPQDIIMTVPTNTDSHEDKVHYIYMEYTHNDSMADGFSTFGIKMSQINPGLDNRNTILLGAVIRRYQAPAVLQSDILIAPNKRLTLKELMMKKSESIVSEAPPLNPDVYTYWYQDMGESFNLSGDGLIIGNAGMTNQNEIWFANVAET